MDTFLYAVIPGLLIGGAILAGVVFVGVCAYNLTLPARDRRRDVRAIETRDTRMLAATRSFLDELAASDAFRHGALGSDLERQLVELRDGDASNGERRRLSW